MFTSTSDRRRLGIVGKEISEEEKAIIELIKGESTHDGIEPLMVVKYTKVRFFHDYCNKYKGWFIDVLYDDAEFELWLAVDLRETELDSDWFVQKIR